MKICLAAVNAKYIHTNPAVRSLRAFALQRGYSCGILENSINQTDEQILRGIWDSRPDVLAFSVYLWNCETVYRISRTVRKILPGTQIWYGGPEVSFRAEECLAGHPEADGILRGEGEETFAELCAFWSGAPGARLSEIRGITYRDTDGTMHSNPDREPLQMDGLPFPYEGTEPDPSRILYYESSRGCPFRCAYCLSSVDKTVRFRNIRTVERELQWFLDRNVPQVKFTDRTFNCSKEHAMAVWNYIREHDNGVTNFHFEIDADLLDAEEMDLLSLLRPGQVQFEIGVQTTNPDTMRAVRRTADFGVIADSVRRLRSFSNIHIHLDLIAGLPLEDLASFRRSFNDVYSLRPDQLQLGFLKVLRGTEIEKTAGSGRIVFSDSPPYEVLYTDRLSHADVLELKGVEEMTEVYWNSGQFRSVLPVAEAGFPDAYSMYRALSEYYFTHGFASVSHSRLQRYEILLGFLREYGLADETALRALIRDAYARENLKNRPGWAGAGGVTSAQSRAFYRAEKEKGTYLIGYGAYSPQQMHSMTHLEREGDEVLLFDYRRRDPLTGNAEIIRIPADRFPGGACYNEKNSFPKEKPE